MGGTIIDRVYLFFDQTPNYQGLLPLKIEMFTRIQTLT